MATPQILDKPKELEKKEKIDIAKGLVGLTNLGNKCYLDSTVQALSNTVPFREYVLSADFFTNLKKKQIKILKTILNREPTNEEVLKKCKETVIVKLYKLFTLMWENVNPKGEQIYDVVTPRAFVDAISEKNTFFLHSVQQDAHEAYELLQDMFHEDICSTVRIEVNQNDQKVNELLKLSKKVVSIYTNEKSSKEEKDTAIQEFEKYKKDNSDAYTVVESFKTLSLYLTKFQFSDIIELFGGLLYSKIICPECKKTSEKFDVFNCLEIPIVMNESKKTTVDDCLEDYCRQEKLDDDNKWYCSTCNKKLNAVKQNNIWKCPKILIISLKRFQKTKTGIRSKIENFVSFPFTLDMKKYITKINDNNNTIYELNAVVNHVGGLTGGHYYCYAKNSYTGKFYNFNDTSVSLMENDKIITENAYLLYYTIKQ